MASELRAGTCVQYGRCRCGCDRRRAGRGQFLFVDKKKGRGRCPTLGQRADALVLPGEGHVFMVCGADSDRCLAKSRNDEHIFRSGIDYLMDHIAWYLEG